MLYFSQTELKRLMLGVLALFALSNLLSAVAPSYTVLVISRIGVALSHALFWSIASPMAVRAAPYGKKASALGFVVTGSSLALIAGLPLGRILGLHVGWRATFLCIGLIAIAVLILFCWCFPRLPNKQDISLKTLPKLLTFRPFVRICFLTLVLTSAIFTAYNYIEPFLLKVGGLSKEAITIVLVVFGGMGLLASLVFSRFYEGREVGFSRGCLCGMGASLLLLYPASFSVWSVFGVCAFWGFCTMLFGLIFQSNIISKVPNATTVALSIYSGIYNIGIGGGALIGGIVADSIGLSYLGYVAGGISILALLSLFIKEDK